VLKGIPKPLIRPRPTLLAPIPRPCRAVLSSQPVSHRRHRPSVQARTSLETTACYSRPTGADMDTPRRMAFLTTLALDAQPYASGSEVQPRKPKSPRNAQKVEAICRTVRSTWGSHDQRGELEKAGRVVQLPQASRADHRGQVLAGRPRCVLQLRRRLGRASSARKPPLSPPTETSRQPGGPAPAAPRLGSASETGLPAPIGGSRARGARLDEAALDSLSGSGPKRPFPN